MRFDTTENLVFEFKIPSWQDFRVLNDLVTPGMAPQAQTYSHLIAQNALCFALINESGSYAQGNNPPSPGLTNIVDINLTATSGAGLPDGILIPYLNTVCDHTGTVRIYVQATTFYTGFGSNGNWTMVLYRDTNTVPLSSTAPMVDPQVVSHYWGGSYTTLCSDVANGLPPLAGVPGDVTTIKGQTTSGGTLFSNAANAAAASSLVTPIGDIHTQTTSGGTLFSNAASAASNTQGLSGLSNQIQLMTQILAHPRNFYPAGVSPALSTVYPPSLYPNLTFDDTRSYLVLTQIQTYQAPSQPSPILWWTCWKDQAGTDPALTLGDIAHTEVAGIAQWQFYAPNTIPTGWTSGPYNLHKDGGHSYLVITNGGGNPDYAWSCWTSSGMVAPAPDQNSIVWIESVYP